MDSGSLHRKISAKLFKEKNTDCFFSAFGPFCNSDINRYFQMDAQAHYTIIRQEEVDKNEAPF